MAKKYSPSTGTRWLNRLMSGVIHLGFGPQNMRVLNVRGRHSGKHYATPVSLVLDGDQRYLVSPYGEVSWVMNARAAGEVGLRRGSKTETVRIEELGPEQSAPVLKRYINQEPFTKPYFDAAPDDPVETFAAEASNHPVFLLHSQHR